MSKSEMTRRTFLAASASTAAFSIVPRNVLGGVGYVAPSDRINLGFVGCGTQGLRQMMGALPKEELHFKAVCDPNKGSNDYIPWGKDEVKNKIRRFLEDPNWGSGVEGCYCGRDVGKDVVEKYYAKKAGAGNYEGCAAYADFREMLEKESDLDAVYIMTPDHLHTTVGIAAMKKGKHIITHKPISNFFMETHQAIETAKKTGLATHMFCAADQQSTPQLCEWIWGGAIGDVREVHNWSSRPFWPQGMTEYPTESVAIPEGLDWHLWLGPSPDRPYHPALTHAVFRGWFEFGAGALGDMGHYSMYQVFKIMKLGMPETIEASRSQYWAIIDHLWQKQENRVAYPRASTIHWEFPAREGMPPLSVFWYDGGIRPPKPTELDTDGEDMPAEGMLFVGDKGKILCTFNGGRPRLIPKSKMDAFTAPPEKLPRPIDELDQWIRACQGGEPAGADFGAITPLAKSLSLGNIALRIDQKLKWDDKAGKFANSDDANELMLRKYRPGWEIEGASV